MLYRNEFSEKVMQFGKELKFHSMKQQSRKRKFRFFSFGVGL
jgi:hypothetical protein